MEQICGELAMRSIFATVLKTAAITSTSVLATIIFAGFLIFLANYAHLTQLQAQLAKPGLPISVGFAGQGSVAIFKNNSGQILEIQATLTSPTNRPSRYELLIPSWGAKEIGPLDGWTFLGGQRITLTNTNFRPMKIDLR